MKECIGNQPVCPFQIVASNGQDVVVCAPLEVLWMTACCL